IDIVEPLEEIAGAVVEHEEVGGLAVIGGAGGAAGEIQIGRAEDFLAARAFERPVRQREASQADGRDQDRLFKLVERLGLGIRRISIVAGANRLQAETDAPRPALVKSFEQGVFGHFVEADVRAGHDTTPFGRSRSIILRRVMAAGSAAAVTDPLIFSRRLLRSRPGYRRGSGCNAEWRAARWRGRSASGFLISARRCKGSRDQLGS